MKVWILVVNPNFMAVRDIFSVDVGSCVHAEDIKTNTKERSPHLAQTPDSDLVLWEKIGKEPFYNAQLLKAALGGDPLNVIKMINGNEKVAHLGLSAGEILVLQKLSGMSRISTAPEAF